MTAHFNLRSEATAPDWSDVMFYVMRVFAGIFALLAGLTGQANAQADPPVPIAGGANAISVACVQVGDLSSGAFVGTFLQGNGEAWEERPHMRGGIARFQERQRTETMVELTDPSRGLSLQFDFERKLVRTTPANQPPAWRDLYHMLSATDKDNNTDCAALARSAGGFNPAAAANQSTPPRRGGTTVQFISIKIGTLVIVPPGTKLLATSGPPCPGQPGFFLCPNKFTCAPTGGVCCPGAGSCGAGTFCDRFVPNACIGPGDPAFCPGTGDPLTGVSLHCAPGSVCMPGNICNP